MLLFHQEVSNLLSLNPQDFTYRIGQRMAESNVMIKDGHTLVIGGLIRDETKVSDSGMPLLRQIPGIGWLFRRKSLVPTKSELLIFVTPHVIGDQSEADAINEHQQMKHPRTLDATGEEFRL